MTCIPWFIWPVIAVLVPLAIVGALRIAAEYWR